MTGRLDHNATLEDPRAITPDNRLLLFAMRRMAFDGLQDAYAVTAMLNAFGMRYRRPLVLLRALMAELARVAQRPITVAPCCCIRTTPAESALLNAIAYAPHDPAEAAELLAPVLGVKHCLGAVTTAAALGQAFEDLGHPLCGV